MNAVAQPQRLANGWSAWLRLGFHRGVRRTELSERARHGPLSVQRPFYPEGEHCHVYLLHPPGGVVGGDRLEIEVHANGGSGALITTPGAAKYYRSAGNTASQIQNIQVDARAALEWLPQENIFFSGARVSLQTRIEIQRNARLAWWEIQCLGRPAVNESFDHGEIDNRFSLYREGKPVLVERTRINNKNRHYPALGASRAVLGTFIISGCESEQLDQCRDWLAQEHETDPAADLDRNLGLTLIDDFLVARYLGDDTVKARAMFTLLWRLLRKNSINRSPITPRIWLT